MAGWLHCWLWPSHYLPFRNTLDRLHPECGNFTVFYCLPQNNDLALANGFRHRLTSWFIYLATTMGAWQSKPKWNKPSDFHLAWKKPTPKLHLHQLSRIHGTEFLGLCLAGLASKLLEHLSLGEKWSLWLECPPSCHSRVFVSCTIRNLLFYARTLWAKLASINTYDGDPG